jgi:hypothetical protein
VEKYQVRFSHPQVIAEACKCLVLIRARPRTHQGKGVISPDRPFVRIDKYHINMGTFR